MPDDKNLVTTVPNFLQQPPINRAHDLGGYHGTAVPRGKLGHRFAVVALGALGFKIHQGAKTFVVHPRPQVCRWITETLQVFERQVNAFAIVEVRAHIADNVR